MRLSYLIRNYYLPITKRNSPILQFSLIYPCAIITCFVI